MSRRTTLVTSLLALACAAAPLAAQEEGGMMAHDTAMMDHGEMMDHGQMMDHDSAMGTKMGADRMFMGVAGGKAAGDYEIVTEKGKQRLRLTEDFRVPSAPDLYLVLASGDTPDAAAVYVAELKRPSGAQTYDLPKGKDLSLYSRLLVWSKKEKRAVASAEWHAGNDDAMGHM